MKSRQAESSARCKARQDHHNLNNSSVKRTSRMSMRSSARLCVGGAIGCVLFMRMRSASSSKREHADQANPSIPGIQDAKHTDGLTSSN